MKNRNFFLIWTICIIVVIVLLQKHDDKGLLPGFGRVAYGEAHQVGEQTFGTLNWEVMRLPEGYLLFVRPAEGDDLEKRHRAMWDAVVNAFNEEVPNWGAPVVGIGDSTMQIRFDLGTKENLTLVLAEFAKRMGVEMRIKRRL